MNAVSKSARYFPGINGLRAFAALLVVLQHSIFYACSAVGVDFAPYLRTGFGSFGVMMFFCISGFVITINRNLGTLDFITRRILRIYPPYLIACLFSVVLLRSIGQPAYIDLKSLILFPSDIKNFNESLHIPYWTLIFEVAFYALAAVAFSFKLQDRTYAIAAITWVLIVQLCGPYFDNDLVSKAPSAAILLSPYTQLFAFGSMACLYFERLSSIDTVLMLMIAAVAFIVPSLVKMQPAVYTLFYAFSSAAIVVSAARATSRSGVLKTAGDASYGVYLLHLPILFVFSAVLEGKNESLLLAWLAITAAALSLSIAFGIFESFLHGLLMSRLKNLMPNLVAVAKPIDLGARRASMSDDKRRRGDRIGE